MDRHETVPLPVSGLRQEWYLRRQVAEHGSADYRGSLGRYALYGEIAAGGMATVHLARLLGPVGFARTVAIKRLHPHLAKDPEFVSMFLEEARLAARVRHPNVVATLDVVSDDGELFLVMEYEAGETLSRIVRNVRERGERVPPRFAVAIVSGALEGLHAAHDAKSEKGQPLGLVHRDVSPQNVHVGVDGVTRLLDFGIAKATNRVQETRTDQIKGKVAYMSPEQLAKGAIDRRADVYSASVVLWETLTGERLFKADDVPSLVYAIINEDVRRPSSLVADLPHGLDAIVMKGLERDADHRWSSAREMATALEGALAVATPREIGAWVHAVAGDTIDWRQDLVDRVESETSSSIPPPMSWRDLPSGLTDMTSGVVPSDRDEAAGASDEADATSAERDDERETMLASDPQTPSATVRPRAAYQARALPHGAKRILAIVMGGVVVLGGSLLFKIRWAQTAPDPAPTRAPTAEGATTPAESESAIVIGVQRNPPIATATGSGRSPRGVVSGSLSREECDTPFTVDARGTRHPKPQCLTKK